MKEGENDTTRDCGRKWLNCFILCVFACVHCNCLFYCTLKRGGFSLETWTHWDIYSLFLYICQVRTELQKCWRLKGCQAAECVWSWSPGMKWIPQEPIRGGCSWHRMKDFWGAQFPPDNLFAVSVLLLLCITFGNILMQTLQFVQLMLTFIMANTITFNLIN